MKSAVDDHIESVFRAFIANVYPPSQVSPFAVGSIFRAGRLAYAAGSSVKATVEAATLDAITREANLLARAS